MYFEYEDEDEDGEEGTRTGLDLTLIRMFPCQVDTAPDTVEKVVINEVEVEKIVVQERVVEVVKEVG